MLVEIGADIVIELAHRMTEMGQGERCLIVLQELVADDQMAFHHAEAKKEVGIVGVFVGLRTR